MAKSFVQQNFDHHWTAEEVRALPDDGVRYEVVDGELLVSPAPRLRHQQVVRRFMMSLGAYLEPVGLEDTFYTSPADISWASDVLVQPDIFVVTSQETGGEWSSVKTLWLAIEVLSPTTRRADEWTKRLVYQKYGVGEYWVVDADAKTVNVWRPSDAISRTVTDTLVWRAPSTDQDCVIDLAKIFA